MTSTIGRLWRQGWTEIPASMFGGCLGTVGIICYITSVVQRHMKWPHGHPPRKYYKNIEPPIFRPESRKVNSIYTGKIWPDPECCWIGKSGPL